MKRAVSTLYLRMIVLIISTDNGVIKSCEDSLAPAGYFGAHPSPSGPLIPSLFVEPEFAALQYRISEPRCGKHHIYV